MSILKTNAIVLRKWDFRETSVIISFFTEEFGKISGLLKGIRKDNRKFASTVEPFSFNEIIFYKSRRSSLHLVTQCDLKNNFTPVRNSMFKVGIASSMIELVEAVMPEEDKNNEVFNLVIQSLEELTQNNKPEKIMTIFKIKLLMLSGFKPHLDSCISCGSTILGMAKFSLKSGGLLCETCIPKDRTARTIFRGTVATILYIEKNDFKNNLNLGISMEIQRELNLILNSFIKFHLEQELKSERVLTMLNQHYRRHIKMTDKTVNSQKQTAAGA